MSMEALDRVFSILFEQARREAGGESRSTAARRAVNRLAGYLVFPVAAMVVLSMLLWHLIVDPAQRLTAKGPWQVLAVLVYAAVYTALSARYRKYVISPEKAVLGVSAEDTRYLRWFRYAAVGSLLVMLSIAAFLHLAKG